MSITDNDEEPTTEPDEPIPEPDEPQTANLIHKWLGVDTAEVDTQYGYSTLHDQAGELDLTSAKFWTNNTNEKGDYVVEEYRVQQKFSADLWDMPDGMSFSMKINQYTRLGNYFSALEMLHTGAIKGMNITTDNWSGYNGTVIGRFKLFVASTGTSAFGNGVISIKYQNSTGLVELKGDSTIKMLNRNDTVDILLTFDSETNTVELYQDGTKVLSSVLDVPLKIDGIINNMTNTGDHTYESIEIYDGILSVDNDTPEEITTYTITNNLTNLSNNNSASNVNEGTNYTATLSANDGYVLDTVTVTMGGTDDETIALMNDIFKIEGEK